MPRDSVVPLTGTSLLFITDTHVGRRRWTSVQLANAGKDIDELEGLVSGVAVGGDLINWATALKPEDEQWAAWFADRRKSVPWARVAGNHDLAAWTDHQPTRTAQEWLEAIGEVGSGKNQARDLGGVRVLAVSPDTWARPDWDVGLSLSEDTLNWLEARLSESGKPTWIVAHNPLAQQYPGHMEARTQNRLTEIISKSGNVLGWLSGHRHSNIKTDISHAKQITVGGRKIAAINGPPCGGQVLGTSLDPWESPLHGMVLTYEPGFVTCRWRNLVSRTWDSVNGSRTLKIPVGV